MNKASYPHLDTHTHTHVPINLHGGGWAVTLNCCKNRKGKNLSKISKSNGKYFGWELET